MFTRGLTLRYIAALTLIAVLALTGRFLVQSALQRQAHDSHIVNIAGRQRMLSQRICNAALAIQTAANAEIYQERIDVLRSTLALWRRSHWGLLNGDPSLGLDGDNSPAVRTMFSGLEPHFAAMIRETESVLASATAEGAFNGERLKPALAVLLKEETPFLGGMDQIVSQFEAEARQRVERLQRTEWILLGILLAVLVVEGLLVFRPAVRRLNETFEMEKALSAARAAAEGRAQLLARVSHEIRTPINAIAGMNGLLLRTRLSAEQREYAQTLATSTGALLRVVNDLLDFAKSDAGKIELECIEFNPAAVVQEAAALFGPPARAKGLRLEMSLDAGLPPALCGDPSRLRQILLNLIGNALKFTESGQISIHCACASSGDTGVSLRFTVQDTGIGIPASARGRLFQAFSQVDNSDTRRYGGSGLGLAICKQLVALMKGEIGFESTPGAGSTFWFTACFALSRTTESAPRAEPPKAVPIPVSSPGKIIDSTRPLRILVADDNDVNLRVLSLQLRMLGLSCDTVRDGQDVLDTLRRKTYDVLFLDCQMPRLDGYRTALSVRDAERSGAPRAVIIALTAHALRGEREKCLAVGMDDYLTKPLTLESLQAALTRWTGRVPGPHQGDVAPLVTTDAAIDGAVLASLRILQVPDDPDMLAEVIELFLAKATRILQDVQAARASGDLERLAELVHELKSGAGTLGARRLADLCTQAEDLCRAGAQPRIEESIVAIQWEFERVQASLLTEHLCS